MKYKTPELIALTPAINAIQSTKDDSNNVDHPLPPETKDISGAAYQDWE